MSIAIQCILEQSMIGLPEMDGRLLCAAFCSDGGGFGIDEDIGPADNLVSVNFGGTSPHAGVDGTDEGNSLFGPLGQFVTGDSGVEWHEPVEGLTVVGAILGKLRSGARVAFDPDFDFFGDEQGDVAEAVMDDLEALEQILAVAQRQQTRFRLVIET